MGSSTQGLAQVIPIGIAPRDCNSCEHARYIHADDAPTWCSINDVVVEPSYDAEDCSSFERVEEGSQPVLSDDPREP